MPSLFVGVRAGYGEENNAAGLRSLRFCINVKFSRGEQKEFSDEKSLLPEVSVALKTLCEKR